MLRWTLRWGSKLPRLQGRAKKRGPSPALRHAQHEQPTLSARLRWYWEAWWILHAGRTYGGGMAPIPQGLAWSELDAYATGNGLTKGERDLFVRLLQAMDRVYLEHIAASHPKSPPKPTERPARRRW